MIDRSVQIYLVFMLIYLLSMAPTAFAETEDYYHMHRSGWHWYQKDAGPEKQQQGTTSSKKSVDDEMNAVRAKIETAQKKMILEPTVENSRRYYLLQLQLLNQADRVSESWKQMFLNNPELDYSLVNPGNSLGRQIATDQEKQKEDAAIKLLGEKSGLFFFYRSTCPYCRGFAPTIKRFAETYHIKVIAITTDGIRLPEFPDSYIDQGQAATFQVKAEPALFAVNPYSQKAFPIAYGLISLGDLRRKILAVATLLREER